MQRSKYRQIKASLMKMPNVIGVGKGYKTIDGLETDQECVVVLVEKKVAPEDLPRSARIPPLFRGEVTDVVEVGRIKALLPDGPDGAETLEAPEAPDESAAPDTPPHGASTSVFDPYATVARNTRIRPAPGGVSIGHPDITAGTLGSVVWSIETGEPLILSNNHVLAASSTLETGMPLNEVPILQPGTFDGGTVEEDTIGTLFRFVPLRPGGFNRFDAALARPLNPDDVTPEILDIGTISTITDPKLRMQVRKSGRSSGLTSGRISLIDADIEVDYGLFLLTFTNQVISNIFSRGGDSGSVIVGPDNTAVGLLFAGSDIITAFCPMRPLAEMLGFTFENPGGASSS